MLVAMRSFAFLRKNKEIALKKYNIYIFLTFILKIEMLHIIPCPKCDGERGKCCNTLGGWLWFTYLAPAEEAGPRT
jgi:hypothetical protein